MISSKIPHNSPDHLLLFGYTVAILLFSTYGKLWAKCCQTFRFGNIDVKYFTEQAMRLTADPKYMRTVIGTVSCEAGVLVEWKVGYRERSSIDSQAWAQARTGVLGWVAAAVVAMVMML